MKHHFFLPALVAGVIAVAARADDKPAPEVLGRGPVHEAYAQPFEQNPAPNQAVDQKPPDPVPEEPPAEKPAGKNVQFIPGYWQWDGDKKDYIWVSGFWRDVPSGRRWVMGYWSDTTEGYRWVSGHWADAKEDDFQYVPTPPENPDQGPATPAPDDNSFYIPGSWFYTDNGYQYRDGYWADCRAGYLWVPSRYFWSPRGWIFASGYWDYGFGARGLLYAPVYFGPRFGFGPGYYYRPSIAYGFGFGFAGAGYGFGPWGWGLGAGAGIGWGPWGLGAGAGIGFSPFGVFAGARAGLGFGPWGIGAGAGFGFDSVFVRSGYGHYYFGNYHTASYLRAGYTPLVHYGARSYDPVFASERHVNRTNPNWVGNVQKSYVAKLNGTQAAPSRTFATGQTASPMRSMSQLQQSGMKLEKVSSTQLQKQTQVSRQMTSQSQQMFRGTSQARVSTSSVPRIGASNQFRGGSQGSSHFSNNGASGNFRSQAGSVGNAMRGPSNPGASFSRPQSNFQGFQGQMQGRPVGNMPSFGGHSPGGFSGGHSMGGFGGGGSHGGGHSAGGGRR